MKNFMESLGDYLDYLEAKSDFLPALFAFGVGTIMISTVVILCALIITEFGFIGFVSLLVFTWFVLYAYHFYNYRKGKTCKNLNNLSLG